MRSFAIKFYIALACFALGCGPSRPPVPPGVIPAVQSVSPEDESYGHQVLSSLMDKYPLDTNDTRINRVRDIVRRLTDSIGASQDPWHVYLLVDSEFKNAAATRGNYIFVWTGILETVQDDTELATILAHEIGHVLAGHTNPDPNVEVNNMLSGVLGNVASEVVARYQGPYSPLASLAEGLVRLTFDALVINPDLQEDELEADHIGLFLMSQSGFDPEAGVGFWRRIKDDPDFSGFPIAFLSSHPSSDDRIEQLEKSLPEASRRYQELSGGLPHTPTAVRATFEPPKPGRAPTKLEPSRNSFVIADQPPREVSKKVYSMNPEIWLVIDAKVPVLSAPDSETKEAPKGTLFKDQLVTVTAREGRYLQITKPIQGFVLGSGLSPTKPEANEYKANPVR